VDENSTKFPSKEASLLAHKTHHDVGGIEVSCCLSHTNISLYLYFDSNTLPPLKEGLLRDRREKLNFIIRM
jgi:hypothetical protein